MSIRKRMSADEIFNYISPYIAKSHPCEFVYFISDGEYVKIGVTKDIYTRLHNVRTCNCRKIELLFTLPFENREDAERIESFFHYLFQEYRIRGEWFDILEKINNKNFLSRFQNLTSTAEENSKKEISKFFQTIFFGKE